MNTVRVRLAAYCPDSAVMDGGWQPRHPSHPATYPTSPAWNQGRFPESAGPAHSGTFTRRNRPAALVSAHGQKPDDISLGRTQSLNSPIQTGRAATGRRFRPPPVVPREGPVLGGGRADRQAPSCLRSARRPAPAERSPPGATKPQPLPEASL